MSSKSRKGSPKKQRKSKGGSGRSVPVSGPVGAGGGEAAPPASEHHKGLDIPDEILTAPRETSKLKFALMILLVVFLLIVFMVPDAIMGTVGSPSGGEDPPFLSWRGPDGDEVTLTYGDFALEKRALTEALGIDPLTGFALGITGEPTDEDTARFLVLERLAEDAGIRVPLETLGLHLRDLFTTFNFDKETYLLVCQQRGGVAYIEATLRRLLRVQRYQDFAGFAGAMALPTEIEAAWHDRHEELAYDYVAVTTEDYEEAAREEIPEDAELEAWLEERSDFEKAPLMEPLRRRAQVVAFRDPESTPATGLLEAFPPDEEEDPEDRANRYYNRVFTVRFLLPEGGAEAVENQESSEAVEEDEAASESETPQEETEAGEDETAEDEEAGPVGPTLPGMEGQSTDPVYRSFEEVKDTCLVEAPVYFAMQDWLDDLQGRREAGEELDLAAEAEQYGLAIRETEPMSRPELGEDEALGNPDVVNAVFDTPVGAFAYGVQATEDELLLLRVLEEIEPALPAFEEIRDEVVELWVSPRARELAEERLTALFEGFEEFTPEEDPDAPPPADPDAVHRRASAEDFRAKVEEAGLTVERGDWRDKAPTAAIDFANESDFDAFERQTFELRQLEVDEVAAPRANLEGTTIYLVRLDGRREVPLERMSPRDYDSFKRQARTRAASATAEATDFESLAERYGLAFLNQDEEAGDEEGEGPEG